MHITFYPQASGGGPAAQDRFWPRYLVGNVPAGDSPVAYSVAGFDYIPDLGNGAGIAAALALAVADPGVVGVRRGSYDLNAAGAPVTPFVVPAGTIVQGMGPYIIGLNPPTGQIVARSSGDQQVFALDGNGAQIRDLMIIVPESPPGAVFAGADSLVEFTVNGSGGCENIVIISFGLPTASLIRSFYKASDPNAATFDHCYALHFGAPRLGNDPAEWLSAFHIAQPSAFPCSITDCISVGHDVAIFSATPSSLITVSGFACLSFYRRGIYQDVGATGVIGVSGNSYFVASDVDALGAELRPFLAGGSNFGASLVGIGLIGAVGAMTQPAVKIHGDAGGAGYVRVLDNFFLWSRAQGSAIVEIGDAGSPTPCDRNMVQNNQFNDTGAGSDGVAILDLANTTNFVQNNSMAIGGVMVVDAGTLTQIAGNA